MAKTIGRLVTVTFGSASFACQEKSITMNGEPVDVSDDGSSGWRELLATAGELSVDVSVDGVTKSDNLRRLVGTQAALTVTYPATLGSFTGTFMLVSYEEGAPYKEALTFSASFQSAGAVTDTAGTP